MLVGVTGASGFIGRHLLRRLATRGHRMRILVRDSAPADCAAETITGHLSDPDALRALVASADAVVHLVGIIAERGRATFAAVHVDGTRNLVDAARAAGVRRLVFMSALGARDEPGATPYHRTKAQAEAIVRASGIPAAVFRPALISGHENVPIRTLARLHRFLPAVPVFGDGSYPMQPIWIEDVTEAFALAVERPGLTGDYEVAGPDRLSYAEFLRAIGRACGHPRPLIRVPLGAMRLAARIFDIIPGGPITSDQLQMLIEGSVTARNAITTVFGITPLSFDDGLRRFLGGSQGG